MRNLSSEAKGRSRAFRRNLSPAEVVLWSRIKGKALGFTVRRQYPVGPYFLDFYIPKARLCVEVDGSLHEHRVERDLVRDRILGELGIDTLRISASAIGHDLDEVVQSFYFFARSRIESAES